MGGDDTVKIGLNPIRQWEISTMMQLGITDMVAYYAIDPLVRSILVVSKHLPQWIEQAIYILEASSKKEAIPWQK